MAFRTGGQARYAHRVRNLRGRGAKSASLPPLQALPLVDQGRSSPAERKRSMTRNPVTRRAAARASLKGTLAGRSASRGDRGRICPAVLPNSGGYQLTPTIQAVRRLSAQTRRAHATRTIPKTTSPGSNRKNERNMSCYTVICDRNGVRGGSYKNHRQS